MALVTDNLTYLASYTPFERPPEAVTLNSFIPRGIRRFFLQTDTAAKPVNDEIIINMTATLPDQFAYVLRAFNVHLEADFANDFNGACLLRLFNHIPGQPLGNNEVIATILNRSVLPAGSAHATATVTQLSNFVGPFWSTKEGSVTFRAQLNNTQAQVLAAGFVTTHVEFLEYDLVQAQRYWIETPIPTIQR